MNSKNCTLRLWLGVSEVLVVLSCQACEVYMGIVGLGTCTLGGRMYKGETMMKLCYLVFW